MSRKDLREVDTTGHPQDVIIRSMQRTFLVNAWCDWVDNELPRGKQREAYPMGCELMDWLPDICETFERESYQMAAVLYGEIKGKWGCAPWLAIHNTYTTDPHCLRAYVDWGHYAVMEALGHGVSWSDSNEPIMRTTVTGLFEVLPSVGKIITYHDGFQWRRHRGQPWKR